MDFKVTKRVEDEEKVVDAEIYFERGARYLSIKKYKEAIENFKKALEINSEDYETKFNLAVAYFHSGNYDLAISLFEELISEGHNDADLYFNIGS
ncbi:MAG: tetratricopeptide repeat protein, partial [Thermoplasmatales archaeon]